MSVLAGECARNTQSSHDSLGTRIRKSHQFCSRYHLADTTGDFVLEFGRQREHAPDVHACPGGLVNARIGVAENDGAVSQSVIDVLVVVEIDNSCALATLDVDRLVLAPVTEVGRHTEWQFCERFLEVLIGIFQAPHMLPQAGAGCPPELAQDRIERPLQSRKNE